MKTAVSMKENILLENAMAKVDFIGQTVRYLMVRGRKVSVVLEKRPM